MTTLPRASLVLLLCALLLSLAASAAAGAGACQTAMDCALNGDCVAGTCHCSLAWSGSASCDVMAFLPVDKKHQPGYYNATAAAWGGYPVKDDAGNFHLFHAQMLDHCDVFGSWTTNSIVARSTSVSGKVEGPYQFAQEVIPSFAHNPTIRRANDGTFVLYFIGGWKETPKTCGKGGEEEGEGGGAEPIAFTAATAAFGASNCTAGAAYDPATSIRVGGDYKTVPLAEGSTIADCAASCCSDSKCYAFSFNNMTASSITCNHKDASNTLLKGQCPCCAKGSTVPGCSSGSLASKPPTCDGRHWPKSCGPNMPGPSGDCCGATTEPWNANSGCGLSMAYSKTAQGPWTMAPLNITNQWESDEVYCTHTNPGPFFLKNGSVVLVFNAGYCSNNHLETIGIAVADSWDGEYKLLNTKAILRNTDGTPHRCEDPYVWHDERGWHLLTHNQQGPQGVASYGYSEDAITWTLSPTTPYGCEQLFTDGTNVTVSGCGNRPQIIFEGGQSGGAPLWITNGGASNNPSGGKGQWTLFRQIKH